MHVLSRNIASRSCVGVFVPTRCSCQWIVRAHLSATLHGLLGGSELLLLSGLRFFAGPAFFVLLVGRGVTPEIPGIVHHKREVVVVVNTAGNVFIVLDELL